jgi:hypothetical protein
VVAVELRLDGVPVGRRGGPPWRFEIDFGAELAPHELTAVGLDDAGGEVARARQWINLPRGTAEARFVLESDGEGWPVAARLAWASLWRDPPARVELRFDGHPLAPSDALRIELPPYDPKEVHLLTAELVFANEQRAHAEASFGGVFGERVATELTAVPVVVHGRGRAPSTGELRDAFARADGGALEVVSVEEAGADVIVVRDLASQHALRSTISEVERRRLSTFFETTKDLLPLGRDNRVGLIWPFVTQRRSGPGAAVDPSLFAVSADHAAAEGGLHWLLGRTPRPPLPQRIADAVTVAAVAAAAANRPRAVVLVVDTETPDRSAFGPAAVRRYLARLHVPLFVWTAAEGPGDLPAAWGEVESVATWRDLQAAVRRLRDALDRQTIVWLEGSHLPQAIRLRAGIEGLAIAGAEAGDPGAPSPPAGGG